jgi:5-methylcytosine-specific restriction endonuclease McrA
VNAQKGICAFCGHNGTLDDVAHIIPANGRPVRGYAPYNVFAAHRNCNMAMGNADWTEFVSAFARPDVIPTNWDGFSRNAIVENELSAQEIAMNETIMRAREMGMEK